jgi:hypothetical protein
MIAFDPLECFLGSCSERARQTLARGGASWASYSICQVLVAGEATLRDETLCRQPSYSDGISQPCIGQLAWPTITKSESLSFDK